MSSEFNVEVDNNELFKSILIHELEDILEQAKTLNLNKIVGVEHMESLLFNTHKSVETRCNYLRGIIEENERLQYAQHNLEGRKTKRDVTSLLEAAKVKDPQAVQIVADEKSE